MFYFFVLCLSFINSIFYQEMNLLTSLTHPDAGTKKLTFSNKAPVDDECVAKKDTCHVFVDSDGTIWDAMLNQTNVGNNNNKYYLLQLLEDNSAKGRRHSKQNSSFHSLYKTRYRLISTNSKGTIRSGTMLVCNGNDGPGFKGTILLLNDESAESL